MQQVGHHPYGDAMTNYRRDALIRHPSVPIAAAAELTSVDVPTVRDWARTGSLHIEKRGDMEVVELERVTVLASRRRASRNGALRDRLRHEDGTVAVLGDLVNISDLQELARRRDRYGCSLTGIHRVSMKQEERPRSMRKHGVSLSLSLS